LVIALAVVVLNNFVHGSSEVTLAEGI